MPTKRPRIARAHRPQGLTAEELAWLTGKPVPGMNVFWVHLRGREKCERCRHLLEEHADLIPPGRLPVLLSDLEHWA